MRDDIAVESESQCHLAPFLGLQIESDAFLAAIDREEVGAEAGPAVDAKQPPDLPALSSLDLDDLRTHVRQQECGVRSLLGNREVEDADSI